MIRFPAIAAVLLIAVFLLGACNNQKSLVDVSTPDVTVISVPGMY